MGEDLRTLISADDADGERIARPGGYVRLELLRLDLANRTAIQAGGPPPDTRGRSDISVAGGGRLATTRQAAGSLRSVILTIGSWLSCGKVPGPAHGPPRARR